MVVADPDGYLLTVCENGYGKRTPFGANTAGERRPTRPRRRPSETPAAEEPAAEEPARTRSRRSLVACATASSAAAARASATSAPASATARWSASSRSATTTTSCSSPTQGMVNRTHVSEIRIIGRNTQGVRIMNLHEGDKIASVAQVGAEEPEEEPARRRRRRAERRGDTMPSVASGQRARRRGACQRSRGHCPLPAGAPMSDESGCAAPWHWRRAAGGRSSRTRWSARSSCATASVVGEGWHQQFGGPHAEVHRPGRGRRGGPRRDALRHAGAVLPPRQDAALHRRRARGRRAPRRRGDGRPVPAGRRRRACELLRGAGVEVERRRRARRRRGGSTRRT